MNLERCVLRTATVALLLLTAFGARAQSVDSAMNQAEQWKQRNLVKGLTCRNY